MGPGASSRLPALCGSPWSVSSFAIFACLMPCSVATGLERTSRPAAAPQRPSALVVVGRTATRPTRPRSAPAGLDPPTLCFPACAMCRTSPFLGGAWAQGALGRFVVRGPTSLYVDSGWRRWAGRSLAQLTSWCERSSVCLCGLRSLASTLCFAGHRTAAKQQALCITTSVSWKKRNRKAAHDQRTQCGAGQGESGQRYGGSTCFGPCVCSPLLAGHAMRNVSASMLPDNQAMPALQLIAEHARRLTTCEVGPQGCAL